MKQILKNLRTTLGISQRQLASFIGGDRTQLVRAENGERNLCDAANLQLIRMIPAYAAVQRTTPTTAENISAEDAEGFAQHAKYCHHKALILQKQLMQMQTTQVAALRLKAFVERLRQETDNNLTPGQDRWLLERAYEAEKRLEQNNGACQRKLELKIAVLQAEAAIYANAAEK